MPDSENKPAGWGLGDDPWWPAPAKLNLFLHITARRSDGYHELQTLFQFVDYCDELRFSVLDNGDVIRQSPIDGVPEQSDLCVRAACLLKKHSGTPLGVDITINKRLPMGGGLGGGSSDAATTLVALNQIWGLSFSVNELAELGRTIGADVPVFIHGSTAWAEGIGEKLTPVELPETWYFVIAPNVHVSTQELFNATELTRDSQPITIRDYFAGGTVNAFENVVRSRYPQVDDALNWLAQNIHSQAKMTGTGSCVFAPVADIQNAQLVARNIPQSWLWFIAKGCNKSPLLARSRQN